MGSDKAFLKIDGTPLAARVAREIGKVCGSVALLGDPARYGSLGLPVLPDEFAGEGPLAGIETALRCTAVDWNLIVACDMPALEAAVPEALFAAAEAGVSNGAIPRHRDGKIEPLCAVYHRRCHVAVRRALEAGVRKVTDVLQTLELTYVAVESGAPFANLNTREDLRTYTNG